jgi:UDP-GlcNAc3NAcA epimerase
MSKKVVTVVGARPQFIKAAAVSRAFRSDFDGLISEVIVHTGQHYDQNMSKVFFDELDIPHPKYNLEISGGNHGEMTGRMLEAIEKVLLEEKPEWVMVYGDTNSTLAGALGAAKLHIPVSHVEAGLRSFNMRMPEEINRILTDRIAALLFCPTDTAVKNLESEGIIKGVHQVGDVMFDVALFYRDRAKETSGIMNRLGLRPGEFALATCHRAENTDNPARLREICLGLSEIASNIPMVFSMHPRTRKMIDAKGLYNALRSVKIIGPLPFLDMMALEQSAKLILTDSGGVQKEAFFYGVPCITMRDETEWVETVKLKRNVLAGASRKKIVSSYLNLSGLRLEVVTENVYGNGSASKQIARKLIDARTCLSDNFQDITARLQPIQSS